MPLSDLPLFPPNQANHGKGRRTARGEPPRAPDPTEPYGLFLIRDIGLYHHPGRLISRHETMAAVTEALRKEKDRRSHYGLLILKFMVDGEWGFHEP